MLSLIRRRLCLASTKTALGSHLGSPLDSSATCGHLAHLLAPKILSPVRQPGRMVLGKWINDRWVSNVILVYPKSDEWRLLKKYDTLNSKAMAFVLDIFT